MEIDGNRVKAIGDPADPKKETDFRLLGRRLFVDRKEKPVSDDLIKGFEEDMKMVDKDHINGFQKAYVYQHRIAQQLTWPFLVYDLTTSVAEALRVTATRYLKKWTGLLRSADTSVLYRERGRFGLQLVDPTSLLRKSQLTKCHIVQHSKDSDVRETYSIRGVRYAKVSRIWRATQALEDI